jgi:uracil DNA glycosylase
MIYTVWGQNGHANILMPGREPLHFADGTVDPSCAEIIWEIHADSWEEACTRYHELQGQDPYIPTLETTAQELFAEETKCSVPLDEILKWINKHLSPEDVFPVGHLEKWARHHDL